LGGVKEAKSCKSRRGENGLRQNGQHTDKSEGGVIHRAVQWENPASQGGDTKMSVVRIPRLQSRKKNHQKKHVGIEIKLCQNKGNKLQREKKNRQLPPKLVGKAKTWPKIGGTRHKKIRTIRTPQKKE